MMNPRENYLAFLNHEDTDYVPVIFFDAAICGGRAETFENGPLEGGEDGFGNNWIPTESAAGQPALDPFKIVCDDVCDWEEKVKFPDLDAFDWQAFADQQLAGVDRTQKVVDYRTWNSIFERFTHLLTFEGALCAMYEEPEASQDLIDAITDYKIRQVDYVAKYFKPDTMATYDDFATERALFMSPDQYRQFFKEPHKRLADAMWSYDIIPQKHTCGYCTDVLDDYIDEGIAAWQSAQPSNDIANIIETKGRKIGVVGGYDTQGKCSIDLATPEVVRNETIRCYDEYGCYGYGYCFFAFTIGDPNSPKIKENFDVMYSTLRELREEEMSGKRLPTKKLQAAVC